MRWPCLDRASAPACSCHRRTSRRVRRSTRLPTWSIQPPRFVELATSGLTVTTPLATLGSGANELGEEPAEACWVDSFPTRRTRPSLTGHRRRSVGRRSSTPKTLSRPRRATAFWRFRTKAPEDWSASAPRSLATAPSFCAEQRGVVGGMTFDRQAATLIVYANRTQGDGSLRWVALPPETAQNGRGSRDRRDRGPRPRSSSSSAPRRAPGAVSPAPSTGEAFAHSSPCGPEQTLVLRIRHRSVRRRSSSPRLASNSASRSRPYFT